METVMTDKFLIAGLAALCVGALLALPASAADDPHPSPLASQVRADKVYPEAPRLAPRLAPDPRRQQIADHTCTAEASAQADTDEVENSDHDLKVIEDEGCPAEPGSGAILKPQGRHSE